MALQIDVISDVVCPWCFIGKRKLARAIALYRERNPAAETPAVTWHPFQLNPGLPESGVDRAEYLRRKFGERSGNIYARVTAIGAQVGIPTLAEVRSFIAERGLRDYLDGTAAAHE